MIQNECFRVLTLFPASILLPVQAVAFKPLRISRYKCYTAHGSPTKTCFGFWACQLILRCGGIIFWMNSWYFRLRWSHVSVGLEDFHVDGASTSCIKQPLGRNSPLSPQKSATLCFINLDMCSGASIIEHMAAVLEAACQHMNHGAWGFDVALRLHLYFLALWPSSVHHRLKQPLSAVRMRGSCFQTCSTYYFTSIKIL